MTAPHLTRTLLAETLIIGTNPEQHAVRITPRDDYYGALDIVPHAVTAADGRRCMRLEVWSVPIDEWDRIPFVDGEGVE